MAKKPVMTDAQLELERQRESGKFQAPNAVTPTPPAPAVPQAKPFTQPMTIAGQTPPPATATTTDPLKDKSVKPEAPAGSHYTWIGGTTTGQWQLYKDAPSGGAPAGGAPTGQVYTASDGKQFTDQQAFAAYQSNLTNTAALAQANTAAAQAQRQSAYDLLYQQFAQYGLGSLVEPLKNMIQDAKVSPAEFSLALQNTDAYKQRFSANQDRIKNGLQALTPAQYIGLEDQYQNIMRQYGLPASYYQKTDALGTQAGFNKLIANDVSPTELEDRVVTATQRLMNADPNVMNALKSFYPNITQGDVLAYTLDPTNALNDIKRKVSAAEIGGAALNQGLMTSQASAEDLAKYGITKAQAQAGYEQIGKFLPVATNLSQIYQGQGVGPYTQQTAEQEVFGTAGSAAAAQQRKKLTQLEQAAFSQQSGTAQNALSRDKAFSPYMLGIPGAGAF